MDTYRAMTVKHAAPLPWLIWLVVSSRCRLGWSSHRGVGWAGRLIAVLAGLVVSSRCRLGWSSHRGVGWAVEKKKIKSGVKETKWIRARQ
jgi:hypothetical protein